MHVVTGSDHAGLQLKAALVRHLESLGHTVTDLGTHTAESCDYPDFATAVAAEVVAGRADRGLLICGTGIGMAMAANKVHGIRAAVVSDSFSARASREHNDANVLCMGERVVGAGLAKEILDAWMGATYQGGRHQRRLDKIAEIES